MAFRSLLGAVLVATISLSWPAHMVTHEEEHGNTPEPCQVCAAFSTICEANEAPAPEPALNEPVDGPAPQAFVLPSAVLTEGATARAPPSSPADVVLAAA